MFDADLDRARRKPGCALCRLAFFAGEPTLEYTLGG
jgi:hypothetical protein